MTSKMAKLLWETEITATNVRRCQNTAVYSNKRNVCRTKVSYIFDILRFKNYVLSKFDGVMNLKI